MTLMAMNTLKYKGEQLIVCTTPDKFEDYIEHTVKHFGLTSKTKNAFLELVRNKTDYEPLDLQASLFVKNIDIEKTIFIHDINDKTLTLENTIRVYNAMQNAELVKITGTGHYKMLWSDAILKIIEKRS